MYPWGFSRAFKGDYHFPLSLFRGRYVWYHLKEVMTPEVWYQIYRSHFHLVSFSEWHYADEPFLSSRLLQLRFVPPLPVPTPHPISMEGYGLGSHLLCLCFCGCVMIGYAISVFTPLFLLFQLSTTRVRHVPIRMVSSIWGRFLMPWPRVSSGICEWVGTSKSRPPVLILRSWTRVEVPGSFVLFEPSDSSW